MKVLFVASEAAPIVKVGGLGDVAGSLPPELQKLGIDIRIALPLYLDAEQRDADFVLKKIRTIEVAVRETIYPVRVYETALPNTKLSVYLFENKQFLSGNRHEAIYSGTAGLARFMFFSRAVVSFLEQNASWTPDVIHLNDWHAALVPMLLQTSGMVPMPKTLLTIHNLPYQGLVPASLFKKMGFSEKECDIIYRKGLIFARKFVSILREGIKRADYVSTVSRQYAKEILTPEYGVGLQDVLYQKKDRLEGILNGIDYEYWNSAKDPHIYAHHSSVQGKQENKRRLVQELGLMDYEKPLIAFVGRLDAHQKGIDILFKTLQQFLPSDAHRYIVLGQGSNKWESALRRLAKLQKGKLAFIGSFDEPLAHKIYAGADMVVIPSKYEPCGLVQMIAMRYGTIPIARKTGGLADSIRDKEDGFLFEEYSAAALGRAINTATSIYQRKDIWNAMVEKAMAKDFSWNASAKKYLELYEKVLHNE